MSPVGGFYSSGCQSADHFSCLTSIPAKLFEQSETALLEIFEHFRNIDLFYFQNDYAIEMLYNFQNFKIFAHPAPQTSQGRWCSSVYTKVEQKSD